MVAKRRRSEGERSFRYQKVPARRFGTEGARALNRPMAISNRMPWRCRCALIIKRRYNKARIIGHKASGVQCDGVGRADHGERSRSLGRSVGHLSQENPRRRLVSPLWTSAAITIRHPLFRRPLRSPGSFPWNDENHASRLIVDRARINETTPAF